MTASTQSLMRVRDRSDVDLDLTVEELLDAYPQAPAPTSHPASTERDFDRLYEEFMPRVRGLIKKLICDPGQAEDLVQETFLRAYNAGIHFEYQRAHPEHSQWPWLAAVARNLSLDVLRRHTGVTEEELDVEEFPVEARGADPDLHLLASRRRETIADALNSVSDRHRRVLFMKCVEGKTYDDIAAFEGISVEALKSVLARARRTFRTSYAMLAERRGLGVLLGGSWLRTIPTRLRSLRDRVVGGFSEGVAQFMTAAGPATANAIATAAVLATAAVVGAALSSSPAVADTPALVSESRPAPRVAAAADARASVATTVAEAAVDVETAPVAPPVAVAVAPAAAAAAAPAAAPVVDVAPTPPPAEATGGEDHSTEVDTGEIVPVEDPPVSAQASAGMSEDGSTWREEHHHNIGGEGEGSMGADCSPESRQKSVTMNTTCMALETVDDANLPTEGL